MDLHFPPIGVDRMELPLVRVGCASIRGMRRRSVASARNPGPSRPFGRGYAVFMLGYTAVVLFLVSVSNTQSVPPVLRVLAILVAGTAGTFVTIDMRRKLAAYREALHRRK